MVESANFSFGHIPGRLALIAKEREHYGGEERQGEWSQGDNQLAGSREPPRRDAPVAKHHVTFLTGRLWRLVRIVVHQVFGTV